MAENDAELAKLRQDVERLEKENRRLKSGHSGRWRKVLASIFLVLGLLAFIPAGMLVWLNRTVTNTDNYVAAVGPVIEQPAVQKAVQQAATNALFADSNITQTLTTALPDKAQFLALPLTGAVKNFGSSLIAKVVASQQFATVWVNVNRRAQQSFMHIAQNRQGDPTVDLNDVYGFISTQLAGTPLAGLAGKTLPPKVGQITVANVPALATIAHYAALLNGWRWIMVAAALGLLALAIAVAKDRRKLVVWTGLGLVVATFITFLLIWIGHNLLLGQINDQVYKDAAAAVWHTVLNRFYIQSLIVLIIGLVVALVGYLFGPSRVAVTTRKRSQFYLGSWRQGIFPHSGSSAFFTFIHKYHRAILWVLLVVALALAVASIPLTFGSLTGVLIFALIALIIIEFLAAPPPGKQA